ncbi:MAG TPA: hypothetical protein DIU35_05005 [Candidatus Latescibacteria bacterium]|nr:hypothetical protein [Candidatus Latescibacterota bacterium]
MVEEPRTCGALSGCVQTFRVCFKVCGIGDKRVTPLFERSIHLTSVEEYKEPISEKVAHPTDRIIVGTERIESVPIITGDRRIIEYPQVNTIW